MDIVSPETRSRMMSGIRGRDTAPEMIVRTGLHRRGFRYRLHQRRLPGTPDLVLTRYRAAIFVHGCFWHRHAGCRFASTPATREAFWAQKFAVNVTRDARNAEALLQAGWRVAIVWECGLRTGREQTLEALAAWLVSAEGATDARRAEFPLSPPAPRASTTAEA